MAIADDDLLRRSGAGDREAFTTFMHRHSESVHRFLLSLGAPREDAEDALQDCFVAAWQGAASFRGEGSARGWLLSIARNALRRQHRRRVGEPDTLDSLETLGDRAGWGSEWDFSRRLEALDELDWGLARLPEEEREVVVSRDVLGMTGAETAEALDLSLAAMKSRLHRGRLRLMGELRTLEVDNA